MNLRLILLMISAGALAGAAEGVEIGLSVEGQAIGGPLLIRATAVSDNPLAENWVEEKTLSITGPDGAAVGGAGQLRWTRVDDGTGRALWTVDPATTRDWHQGEYKFSLGNSFVAIALRPQDSEEENALLMIRWKMVDGQIDSAVNDLNAWIDSHGGTIPSLTLKADLLEQTGDANGALDALGKALRMATAESPTLLLRRQKRLLDRLWE